MIKANELRKGNWLMAPLGEYVQVDVIGHMENENYVHASNKTGSYSFGGQNGFEPVLLTPEILEKAGFEDKGHSTYWHTNPSLSYVFKISHVGNGKWFSVDVIANKPIRYVHELQNLYFALTGEELEIKL